MSRKKRGKAAAAVKPPVLMEEGNAGVRFPVLAAALILVCAGYFFLNKTDPAGKNIYAALAPLFLLAGYLLVPAALLPPFRRPSKPEEK